MVQFSDLDEIYTVTSSRTVVFINENRLRLSIVVSQGKSLKFKFELGKERGVTFMQLQTFYVYTRVKFNPKYLILTALLVFSVTPVDEYIFLLL